jgi:hypothetical protein
MEGLRRFCGDTNASSFRGIHDVGRVMVDDPSRRVLDIGNGWAYGDDPGG